MEYTSSALTRVATVLIVGTLACTAVTANAQTQQKPDKLQYDSTPAYQEHNTTSPAAAAAGASGALNPKPGKVSAGKQPAPDRANGLGMDAGAASMGKKQ